MIPVLRVSAHDQKKTSPFERAGSLSSNRKLLSNSTKDAQASREMAEVHLASGEDPFLEDEALGLDPFLEDEASVQDS